MTSGDHYRDYIDGGRLDTDGEIDETAAALAFMLAPGGKSDGARSEDHRAMSATEPTDVLNHSGPIGVGDHRSDPSPNQSPLKLPDGVGLGGGKGGIDVIIDGIDCDCNASITDEGLD
jgi:hypothetical protein